MALSSQFEDFSDRDKVYKGVHVRYARRGESRGSSLYSVHYRGGKVGISNPSTFEGVKKTINEDLSRGYTVDPKTGHLVHPK